MPAQTSAPNKTTASSKSIPDSPKVAKTSKSLNFQKNIQSSKLAKTIIVSIVGISAYYYFKSIVDFRHLAHKDGNVSLRQFSDFWYVMVALLLSIVFKEVFNFMFKERIIRNVKA